MKKLFVTLLVLSIMITVFSGCGVNFTSQNDNTAAGNSITDNTGAEAPGKENKSLAPAKNDLKGIPLALNETITVGNTMEVVFDSCEWTEKILPSDTSGAYSYLDDEEGEKYFVVKGKIKNLTGEDLDISYRGQSASLLINDTYKADVNAEAEDGDGKGFYSNIKPLQTLNVIFYASVSDELQSISEKVEMKLKLVNNADYINEYFDENKIPFDTYLMTFNN